MAIDYEHLMSLRTRGERVHYSHRDAVLYALGVGLGRDPGNRDERPYVTEHAGAKTLPTFASNLVNNNLLDDCGWDASRVVAHDECVSLERAIDESGTLLLDSEVAAVFDKGVQAGALVTVESRARRERDGQAVFMVRRTWLAAGDGGFGGPRGTRAPPPALPERRPDMTQAFATRPDQALLFHLSAGNAPFRESAVVNRDGVPGRLLPGPELAGLCLQGIACHAILKVICEYDHTLIRSFAFSYAGPAYSGENLVAELWQDANIVSCRLRALERDTVVLDQGRCVLAA